MRDESVYVFIHRVKQRRRLKVQVCDKLKVALLCCRGILLSHFGSQGMLRDMAVLLALHDWSVVICCFVDVAEGTLPYTSDHRRGRETPRSLLPKEIHDGVGLIPQSCFHMKNLTQVLCSCKFVKSSWLWWRFLHYLVQKKTRERFKRNMWRKDGLERSGQRGLSVLQRELEDLVQRNVALFLLLIYFFFGCS